MVHSFVSVVYCAVVKVALGRDHADVTRVTNLVIHCNLVLNIYRTVCFLLKVGYGLTA